MCCSNRRRINMLEDYRIQIDSMKDEMMELRDSL
jgi:hypothetical protein